LGVGPGFVSILDFLLNLACQLRILLEMLFQDPTFVATSYGWTSGDIPILIRIIYTQHTETKGGLY